MRFGAWVIAIAACTVVSRCAHGVVIGVPDPGGNTNPPPIAGWNNVGTMNGASGIYIGNGWVLTAAHVGSPGAINLGGTLYAPDATPAIRLTNPDNSVTDLRLFHLAVTPPLPSLNIGATTPAVGTKIYAIGYGLTNTGPVQYYDASWNLVSAGDPSVAHAGFNEGSGGFERWGTNFTVGVDPSGNVVPGGSPTATINIGQGDLQVFFAEFYSGLADYNAGGNGTSEAQLAGGDSGGAVFDVAGNLIGVNDAKGTDTGQPDSTAIFDNQSAFADLSLYRPEILADVPEPSGLMPVALCGLTLLHIRRRRWTFDL